MEKYKLDKDLLASFWMSSYRDCILKTLEELAELDSKHILHMNLKERSFSDIGLSIAKYQGAKELLHKFNRLLQDTIKIEDRDK